MSEYRALARRWWEQNRPAELAAMTDPQAFFSTLADQIEARVQEVSTALAGPDLPGEPYLEKVGRLNAARVQAREAALDELVWSIGPEEPAVDEPSPVAQELMELHRTVRDELA